MISNRQRAEKKRIAFAATDIHRKSLIEWAYYNQDILKEHELIATGTTADILEGTIGVPVTRLHDGAGAANQQLAALAAEQKLDILLFFWDPLQPLQYENGVRALYDTAVARNIIVACNQATADFVLASALMNKTHAVPVLPDFLYRSKSAPPFTAGEGRRVVLKVNTIH